MTDKIFGSCKGGTS